MNTSVYPAIKLHIWSFEVFQVGLMLYSSRVKSLKDLFPANNRSQAVYYAMYQAFSVNEN